MREKARQAALLVAERLAAPRRVAEFMANRQSLGVEITTEYAAVSLVDGYPGLVLPLAVAKYRFK